MPDHKFNPEKYQDVQSNVCSESMLYQAISY